jgi:hypothetical protein
MKAAPGVGKRLLWLLLCVALGLAVALAGVFFSGSQAWYLAIPGAVALGWLFVADPTKCEPPPASSRQPPA